LARQGEAVVGHLRFYPKAVFDLAAPGLGLCLQQEFPSGPDDDLGQIGFPPLDKNADKTLLVHCMMIAPDEPGRESLRRRGIGRRMAGKLIDWATANGWRAVEATAYSSLPIVYTISGQAGRSFWEDLGFRLVRTEREPLLGQENDFVRTMREQARARGIDPSAVSDRFTMRRDLVRAGAS
jgi:GNAT superfamily N-acetyltransferase